MRALALAALVVPALTVAAQQPTRITLAARSAALPHGFSNVSSVRELPDGRVLVVDMRERSVHVADFATKAVSLSVGRGKDRWSTRVHYISCRCLTGTLSCRTLETGASCKWRQSYRRDTDSWVCFHTKDY